MVEDTESFEEGRGAAESVADAANPQNASSAANKAMGKMKEFADGNARNALVGAAIVGAAVAAGYAARKAARKVKRSATSKAASSAP